MNLFPSAVIMLDYNLHKVVLKPRDDKSDHLTASFISHYTAQYTRDHIHCVKIQNPHAKITLQPFHTKLPDLKWNGVFPSALKVHKNAASIL